ncbi:hypothetical protein JXB02_03170 [Candidatus Woesearchaeota archaeon]|nr:hypothetical protein [Candidatus Woesearchaeota archaeon]
MKSPFRKANVFELILLIVGVGIGILGFNLINGLYAEDQAMTWNLLQTVFLWLVLIVMVILAATMEDVKEELAIVIREHMEETRLLKDISHESLQEIKLLREELARR